MNELDIVCLPDDLPEFIEVDLENSSSATRCTSMTLPCRGVEAGRAR